MNSQKPNIAKISVIMPIYNGQKFLKEAIDSILAQTFTNFELLLINDCSTDNSEAIILSYNDYRINYIKNENNLGLIKTLNRGLDLAKGEFIARMDQDDISVPTRFEKQIQIFKHNPEIGVCGTWFTLFGDNVKTEIIKHPSTDEEIKLALLNNCAIGHPTVMMRRSVVLHLRYDLDFQAAEDYEFWTRLSRGTSLFNIKEPLLNYRVHNTNMSVLEVEGQQKTAEKIVGKQLEFLGISNTDQNIQMCRMLFSGNFRRLSTSDLMKVITFANHFEKQNSLKNNFYEHHHLSNRITKNLTQLFDDTYKNEWKLIPFLLINKFEILAKRPLKNNLKLVAKIILKR